MRYIGRIFTPRSWYNDVIPSVVSAMSVEEFNKLLLTIMPINPIFFIFMVFTSMANPVFVKADCRDVGVFLEVLRSSIGSLVGDHASFAKQNLFWESVQRFHGTSL
jgi:hypothetical protein